MKMKTFWPGGTRDANDPVRTKIGNSKLLAKKKRAPIIPDASSRSSIWSEEGGRTFSEMLLTYFLF